jgi:hypothetical protein
VVFSHLNEFECDQ